MFSRLRTALTNNQTAVYCIQHNYGTRITLLLCVIAMMF